jgi:hypothetical protein
VNRINEAFVSVSSSRLRVSVILFIVAYTLIPIDSIDLRVSISILKSLKSYLLQIESVCEVRTQDPENFDEEVLALVSAWCYRHQDS